MGLIFTATSRKYQPRIFQIVDSICTMLDSLQLRWFARIDDEKKTKTCSNLGGLS